MPTNNRTVQAILDTQSDSEIITTINHNFQVLTERIKELNISLSYLDLLKISTIFQANNPVPAGSTDPDPTLQDANLRNFVSTCWNTLANYAGVYVQCSNTSAIVFKWMSTYDVKNGDFIVKLPNNQSLYLPGAEPRYMVPSYSAPTITFTPASTPTAVTVTLNLSNIPTSGLSAATRSFVSGTTIPSSYTDCRFYIGQEEIFFPSYQPGTTFTIPAGIPTTDGVAYYMYKPSNN